MRRGRGSTRAGDRSYPRRERCALSLPQASPATGSMSPTTPAAASSGVRPPRDGTVTSPISSTSTNATQFLLSPFPPAAAAIATAEGRPSPSPLCRAVLLPLCEMPPRAGAGVQRRGARSGSVRSCRVGSPVTRTGICCLQPGRFARYKDRPAHTGLPQICNAWRSLRFTSRATLDRRVPLAAGDRPRGREQEVLVAPSPLASRRSRCSPSWGLSSPLIWHVTRRRGWRGAACGGGCGRGGGAESIDFEVHLSRFFRDFSGGSAASLNSVAPGYNSKMVCMPGHVKMASVLKLVMMENHTTTDDVINEKNTAQVLQKQLFDAHEPNLLDEDDMHIFGSKPMTDPLDLVCCSTCKKPVKASQYVVHADKCSSGKVDTNDNMVEDHDGPMKPPKKGRKIKLASNGNQKIHIKVKTKSQSECKDSANGFKLDNAHVRNVQPINSTSDPRLTTSVDDAAAISGPESCFRDVPAPLATKMYPSQGNCRLRLKLGQLYRESHAKHLGSYTTPDSSQENGLMASQFSPCDNPALLSGSQKSIVLQTKSLDQLPSSTSELCSRTPQQLTANRPNCSKEIKAERVETQAAFKNEVSRARCNRAAATNSKNKGSKKAQQQPNGHQSRMSSPQ